MPTTRVVHPDQLSAADVQALISDPATGAVTVAMQPGTPVPPGGGASLILLRRDASAHTASGSITLAADAIVVTDGTAQPLVFTDPVEGLREYAEILDLVAEDLMATMETSSNGADLMTWIRARNEALAEADRRAQGNAADEQEPVGPA